MKLYYCRHKLSRELKFFLMFEHAYLFASENSDWEYHNTYFINIP